MGRLVTWLEQHSSRQPPTTVIQATTGWEAVIAHVMLEEDCPEANLPVHVCCYYLSHVCICPAGTTTESCRMDLYCQCILGCTVPLLCHAHPPAFHSKQSRACHSCNGIIISCHYSCMHTELCYFVYEMAYMYMIYPLFDSCELWHSD